MFRFIIKRLAYGFLVILGVILVIFSLFHVLPGDPVAVMMGNQTNEVVRQQLTEDMGLDKPFYTQLGYYLNDLSPLAVHTDTPEYQERYNYLKLIPVGGGMVFTLKAPYLRRSFLSNRLVLEMLIEDVEGTLVLALVAMFLATIVGITFGVFAALYQNTWIDYTLVTVSVLGISTPSFVMAILISIVFAHYLKDYTGLSLTGSLWQLEIDGSSSLQLKNLVLPALTLALRPLAIIVQLTRSSMLEVMSQDYIRTAKAKGLLFAKIVRKHALKNALNPVITAVSGWLASLMAGAFFIEYIFSWKGIGKTTIDAVQNLDLPVIMGATILIAFIFVIVNIVVDILYSLVDPRIRLK